MSSFQFNPKTGDFEVADRKDDGSYATRKVTLTISELALSVPPISEADRERLRQDIATNGVREPIVVVKMAGADSWEILDGRNRYELNRETKYPHLLPFVDVCEKLGIARPTNADLVRYVISANLMRRHLTPDQVAATLAKLMSKPASETKRVRAAAGSKGGRGKAQTSEGNPAKVSERIADQIANASGGVVSADKGSDANYLASRAKDGDKKAEGLLVEVQTGKKKLAKAKEEHQAATRFPRDYNDAPRAGRKRSMSAIVRELVAIQTEIRELAEAKKERVDNLSESARESERGENLNESAEVLESAASQLEEIVTKLEELY